MAATLDPNTTLELCRDFKADRERIFQAFLDADILQTIWSADAYKIIEMSTDPRVGGGWQLAMRDEASGGVMHCSARYTEIDRPARIVWRTKWLDGPLAGAPEARVTLKFNATQSGTRLNLTHEFFPDSQTRDHHRGGWSSGFDLLERVLAGHLHVEGHADREIVISRVFEAPRELVWEAWTNPKHVAQWWGPNGFKTTIHEMDVRQGGVWRHTMHGPDGTDYPNKSVFTEIVIPDRIVYLHGGGKKGGPGAQFEGTWTFEDQGGRTKLTIRMLFPTQADRDRVIAEYGAVEGGKQTLARLATHLTTMSKKEGLMPNAATMKNSAELKVTTPSSREIVMTREFEAPRHLVFDALVKPEMLMRWLLGPPGWTMPVCEVDQRVGGKYRYVWRNEDGTEMGTGGVFREIEPPGRIVATEKFDEAWYPGESLVTYALVEKAGKTTLTLTMLYESQEARDAALSSGMEKGVAISYDRLAEILAA